MTIIIPQHGEWKHRSAVNSNGDNDEFYELGEDYVFVVRNETFKNWEVSVGFSGQNYESLYFGWKSLAMKAAEIIREYGYDAYTTMFEGKVGVQFTDVSKTPEEIVKRWNEILKR